VWADLRVSLKFKRRHVSLPMFHVLSDMYGYWFDTFHFEDSTPADFAQRWHRPDTFLRHGWRECEEALLSRLLEPVAFESRRD
jgi:hypothetical protein